MYPNLMMIKPSVFTIEFKNSQINRTLLYYVIIGFLMGCGSSRKLETKSRSIDTVIKTARSYTGTPYKWGGTSKQGIDCSGLLLKSFESIKKVIPRTSIEQSKIGSRVGLDKVQKGDLVFFAAGKKKGRITHVGLVTDVRGRENVQFIHASSSKGVIEVNLLSKYYTGIFVKAARPF